MGRLMPLWQKTVADIVVLSGIGVHSGAAASLTIYPAEANTGIVFVRGDLEGSKEIVASLHTVCATEFCTAIGDMKAAGVSTVEHLVATLSGLGIDNALIEVEGAEVPIMDGSAAPFVEAIVQSGIRTLDAPRRFIKIIKPIRVEKGRSVGEFLPHDGFALDVTIAFGPVMEMAGASERKQVTAAAHAFVAGAATALRNGRQLDMAPAYSKTPANGLSHAEVAA